MDKRRHFGKRALYLATVAALIAGSAGFVLATNLSSTALTESSTWYQVTTQASTDFPNQPTVAVASVPASVSACTTASQTLTSSSTLNFYLPASSGITCKTGDFAQEFTLTSSATAAIGTYTMIAYTSYGTTPTSGSATATVTISGTALTTAGTVNIYVDYGTTLPPTGGIGELDLVVQ